MTRLDLDLPHGRLFLRMVGEVGAGRLAAGGLRIDATADAATADRLAALMHLKLAVANVPVAGGKVVVQPAPGADRGALLGEIAAALAPYLASGFLLGEDLGATSADVVQVYELAGIDPVAVVREVHAARGTPLEGLPDDLSVSSLMNDEFAGVLAGTGAVDALAAAMGRDASMSGLTASVQGIGTVGLAAARELVRRGVRVTSMADADGLLSDPAGLDVDAVGRARRPDGTVDRRTLAGVVTGDRDGWLTQAVDILVPAAVGHAIGLHNVAQVSEQVRFLVEGANEPVHPEAEIQLEDRGVLVLPDFVANAGSAVAFGMLATGQTTVATVAGDYRARIEETVRRCLTRGGTLRQGALAEATAFAGEAVPAS